MAKHDCCALPQPAHILKLISHPTYAQVAAYKFMAVELDLVPVSSGTIVPDLRWLVGSGLAFIFLLLGWLHGLLG